MLRKTILSAIALLCFFPISSATSQEQPLASANSFNQSLPIPQKKVCKLAQKAQTENPATFEQGKIVGTVYDVVGDVVMVGLDNGGTKHVTLDRREVGHMGYLIGSRVVITEFFCSRINLAPPPPPVPGQAIQVPKIDFTPRQPVIPPPAPREPIQQQQPIEQPAPEPPPEPAPQKPEEIIPQTW